MSEADLASVAVAGAHAQWRRPSARWRRALPHEFLPIGLVSISIVACFVVATLLLAVFWLSFTEGSPADEVMTYTIRNYLRVFSDSFIYSVLLNTVTFSATSLAVALTLALPIAWMLERADFPGKRLVFTFLTVALLVPGFSVALGWLFLLHPRIGIINQLVMSWFGLTHAPFNVSSIWAMGLIEGLSLTPVTVVMTAVVFRNMDGSLEEASRMGGANLRQTLCRVTLPLAWPGILAAAIYVFTIGFAAFDIPAILGLASRTYTFSTYVYHQISPAEGLPEYGSVATLSIFMAMLAAGLTVIYTRVQRQAPRYAVVTGKAYRPALVKLRGYKPLAVGFVAAYFTFSLVLPVLTLMWSSGLPYLQPISAAAFAQLSLANFHDLPTGLVGKGLSNTVALMLLVPTITIAISLCISWVVLRSKIPGRSVFDFFAFLPHTVPSIVFSVSAWLLALFALRDVLPIYGTIWILVLVYVVARISYGTRMINSGMIQIHKDLEESAKVSGARTAGVLRSVVVPLLTPAMMYAWIWIALLSYRELTLPVVLATSENLTLSVVVWSLVLVSNYGQASAVSIIMLAVMLPILLVYWAIATRTGIAPSR